MGTWSTTAPTNLATEWTTMQGNSAQGGYRLRINGNYVYLYYTCRVRACSAWLETGQLCVKVENYSFANGNASPGNSLNTNAYVTNENGVKVYADANTSNMGDSTETAHGHLRREQEIQAGTEEPHRGRGDGLDQPTLKKKHETTR